MPANSAAVDPSLAGTRLSVACTAPVGGQLTSANRQSLPQGSPGVPLAPPSSHSSTPFSTIPSPQRASLHCGVQASVSTLISSSHSSTPFSTIPSPQRGSLHCGVQASVSTLLPSSHSSTPASTIPSPQRAFWHWFVQAS